MAPQGRPSAVQQRLTQQLPLLAIGFLAGTLAIAQLGSLPSMTVGAAWLSAGLLLGLLLRKQTGCSVLLFGLVLGAGYCAWQAHVNLSARLSPEAHATERWFEGHVTGLPEQQVTQRGKQLRFYYQPRDAVLRQLRLSWYQADETLGSGECWRLRVRLRTPRGSLNPGGLDYEGWLFREGIDATGSVLEAQRCPMDDGWRLVDRWRQQLADALRERLEGHPMRPFLLGLTLGERSEIDDAQWRILRRTGVAHLLAISGLHIGLVAGFVFFLVRRGWACLPLLTQRLAAPKAAALATGAAACVYAAMAGFALPTQRALVMLLFVLLAIWLGTRIQPFRLLAWALLLVLLIDPWAGQSAGFWLSFAAVGWIFYALMSRLGTLSTLQAWLYVQVLLGCSLLPLTLLWFNEGSWLTPLVNLVMVPLFFVLVPLIVLSSLLLMVLPQLGGWLLVLCGDGLGMLWALLVQLEAHTLPLLPATAPDSWLVGLALVGLFWLFTPRGWPARSAGLLLCLPLLLTLLGPPAPRLKPGELDVTVLDVGQGLSVVLRSARHSMVYDAGPAYEGGFDAGALVLVPYLRSQGIRRVDRYVQSHGDLDHRGGSEALRRELVVVDELGTDRHCRVGQRWRWDAIEFEVLHPDGSGWEGNNASCVLRVRTGHTQLLLTGDIEREAEASLLRRYGNALEAELLLVPHHGSNSSSGMGLLNHVRPKLAIISAGWRNRWAMPRPEVVARYAVRDIRLLNTADAGAIRLRMSASGWTEPELTRVKQRRIWSAD